jgi:hypothetical protein
MMDELSYKYKVNLVSDITNATGVEHKFKNPVSVGDRICVSKDPAGKTNGTIVKVAQIIHFSDRSIIRINDWN